MLYELNLIRETLETIAQLLAVGVGAHIGIQMVRLFIGR